LIQIGIKCHHVQLQALLTNHTMRLAKVFNNRLILVKFIKFHEQAGTLTWIPQ
jgi:hypothetical protein